MKNLFLTFLMCMSIGFAYSQNTDAQNTTQFDVIRNETVSGANTKGRIADAYEALNLSKSNKNENTYLTASGTNTYTVTLNPAISVLTAGKNKLYVKFTNPNSGAATLNPNGLGAVNIVKDVSTALVSGDIVANRIYLLIYDGTNFQMIGASPDIDSLLPTQTGNSGKYLTTDGSSPSWATVAASGGTVTTVSVTTANGVSGSVATATTTPAITLTLGAITPTSVNSIVLSGASTPTLAVTGTSTISGTHSGTHSGTSSGTNTGDQDLSGLMVKSNNLSDITNAATARTNLELGTAALISSTAGGDLSGTLPTPTVNKINGTALSGLATGILKNTTSTGIPSIATAGDFPTLNQSTTGNAATATALLTGRTIGITGDVTYTSTSFDGTANVTASSTVTKINGVSLAGLATGILKNTTSTGAPSIAVAGDFPTLNQSTTGSATTLTTPRTIGITTGDATSSGSAFDGSANNTNALTLATVNSNVGTFGSATQSTVQTVNAKGLTTAISNVTITPAIGSVTGMGTGVATFIATPSSANFATAITDEVGAGPVQLAHPSVNRQTGTSYTLVLGDDSKIIELNNASANTLTVPLNSSVAYSVNTTLTVVQYGAGQTTIVATGGVTIRSSSGGLISPGQYMPMVLEKIGTDEWYLWNGSAPAALSKTDDTNVTLTLGGAPSTAVLSATSLTLGWTGTLGATRGGTGNNTVATGDILFGSASNTWTARNIFNTSPTAWLHLKAGSTVANTAPLKFTSGTNMTTAEDGAIEYDGTNYFASVSTTRYTLAKSLTNTATLDFGSTAAGADTDLTVTVTGAASGDVVMIGVPNGSVPNNGTFFGWVSASNTVTVRFANNDLLNAKDPASGSFRVSVLKY